MGQVRQQAAAGPAAQPAAGAPAGWGARRRRDRAARQEEFVAFVAAVQPRLRRTAYLMCLDWHLAEDLTQVTLMKLYAVWDRIRRAENLEAYSRRVLLNAVFDQKRRRSRSEVVLAIPPEPTRPAAVHDRDLHVALLAALAALPVRDQAVLVLRHWEDRSVETVAEILDMSPSAVKMRDARALTRLRTLLGDDFAMS
jgi:RNA polymerase sigma-70 factor (sigma-E family)